MRCDWRSVATGVVAATCSLAIAAGPASAMMKPDPDQAHAKWRERARFAAAAPATQNRSHRVGNVWFTITNWGFFGSQFQQSQLTEPDGTLAPSFEFPAGSGINYLFQGAIWFGAVVDKDTLVSVGADGWQNVNETYPDASPDGDIVERSTRPGDTFSEDAISEQDYVAVYFDTLTDQSFVPADQIDGRPHLPIGVKITQTSYSWSYDYAQDFILMDFLIENISSQRIQDSYMALYVDADCWHPGTAKGYEDDYSGYLRTVPSPYPGIDDSINIAWTADNDGDPKGASWTFKSATAISGTRVVRGPQGLQFSFNWWTSNGNTSFDWGPTRRGSREFGTGGLGTPEGDRNKYFIMSNSEFDYDQLFSAVDYSDSTDWRAPHNVSLAGDIANGFDTRYLFSFGPLDDMDPGDSTRITIGYIGGENFHAGPQDFKKFFDAGNPSVFYDRLDFRDFATNAQWAAWVFDNPGFDTDGDLDRGEFYLVNCLDTTIVGEEIILEDCDTVWYQGDGVPDFKGPPPPVPPELEVETVPKKVTLRWSGLLSETTVDDFTLDRDFEGYRLYMGLQNTLTSFSLIASWDIIDYKRYDYNFGFARWLQTEAPKSVEDWREEFGPEFDPADYDSPFRFLSYLNKAGEEQRAYFEPQDWNQGSTRVTESGEIEHNLIRRVSEDTLITPRLDTLIYGNYEAVLDNLLPSQPYFFAVTAFDYGNPQNGLAPLESSPLVTSQLVYPIYSADSTEIQSLTASAYPNPYKLSDDYLGQGYEDRFNVGLSAERERRIHFINLPSEATIRIYTLDGDMVAEIEHPHPVLSETDSKTSWDLISRNTQAVTSGIYYYTVESSLQAMQVGKLVIIK